MHGKTKTIPDWQQETGKEDASSTQAENGAEKEANVRNEVTTGSAPRPEEDPISRSSLMSSAKTWLEHESISDASVDRKASFLESKGLTKLEIDELLHDSSAISNDASPNISDISSSNDSLPSPSSQTSSPNSQPPIITYPEFLLRSHRPKPLVTASSILTTAYATALTAATFYGANKYLLTPMHDALTEARHSLFTTTSALLSELNGKLEGVVSSVPDMIDVQPIGQDGEIVGDHESEASDPTELFHRDVGVQTSWPLNEETSGNEPSGEKTDSGNPTATHATRLNSLSTHLSAIATDANTAGEAQDDALAAVNQFRGYLDELAYAGRRGVMGWDSNHTYGQDSGQGHGPRGDAKVMDEVARFKVEIRSVKGALLSARNFPAGAMGPSMNSGRGGGVRSG